MNLLLHPLLREEEGPRGYLLRLAEVNGLSVRSLCDLGISFNEHCLGLRNTEGDLASLIKYAYRIEQIREVYPAVWNSLTPRYCPQCLANDRYWHVGWELYWCDACPEHQTWLIDRCPGCNDRLSWDRPSLLHCHCGAQLSRTKSAGCPKSVAELSGLLVAKVLGRDGGHPYSTLNALEIQQLNKLIRLIGAYGDVGWQVKPQKIANADYLDVSWPITSLAAEILINGSTGIQGLLEQIHRRYGVPDGRNGRLRGRFGHFYMLLYRGFAEQAFDFLRREFENFVAEHWQGPLGRRNRNFPVSLLARLSWIPANHACRQLGISPRRLQVLVDDGKIAGERYISQKGRTFLVVRRVDVESMLSLRNDEIDLNAATNLLGLKKSRLAAMIRWLIPDAQKTGHSGCPWAIPKDRVDRLIALANALPINNQVSDESVALVTILRFWSWTDHTVADLLIATIKDDIRPVARVCGLRGINGLTYKECDLVAWHQRKEAAFSNSLSIPEAAEVLQIKQEVAYSLVRSGILRTVRERVGRRYATRVPGKSLTGFREAYVLGRDLAQEIGTSPRALAERLDRLDVKPVSGPTVDGCRQYLFARSIALDLALDAMRLPSRCC